MDKGKQNTSSSSNSVGNSSFSGTTTPNAPDWITTALQGITNSIGQNAAGNPQSYVAQAAPLLKTAANSAGDLTTSPWDYNGAADATRGVINAKAPDISSMISKFMSPYMGDVVGATNASLDHSDALQRAQDNLTMAGNGAFGGSGAALTKAATTQAQDLARGTTIGNLENAGYGQALGGATSQAQLQQQQQAQRLSAAQQLASLGSQSAADQRANIATQVGAAQPIQSIDQANASAPLSLTSWASSTLPNLLSQFFGRTTSGTSDSTQSSTGTGTTNNQGGLAQGLGGLAQLAALFI